MKKIVEFLTVDIWRIQAHKLSRKRALLIKPLRVVLLALRGFDEDKCQLHASALTFYSLLSIVPVAAMAFGIAKGFGFQNILQKHLMQWFPGQEEVTTQIVGFAQSLLENTKGGVIAGIGVAILFWAVIKVLGSIEKSFNDIWGVHQGRPLARRFTDYLSMMLICPVLFIFSSSLTVFITTQITLIVEKISLLGAFSALIFSGLKLLPYCMLWAVFTFIYIFMPNTKVNFRSGLLAGIVAGTCYQIVQGIYITFQVGVAKYNAIYGSFAALPLFLVWLQISWLIVLFGAEIAFAHQNVDSYEFEPDCLKVSHAFKRLLALRISHLIVKNFDQGKSALTATDIAHTLETPIRLVRQVLFELTEGGLLSEIRQNSNRELYYQPAQDICTISITSVIDALEKKGVDTIPFAATGEVQALSQSLNTFAAIIEQSPANKLLKEI